MSRSTVRNPSDHVAQVGNAVQALPMTPPWHQGFRVGRLIRLDRAKRRALVRWESKWKLSAWEALSDLGM